MAASKGLTVSPDKIKFKKEVFGVTGATSPTKTVKISNPKDGATVTELTSQITGANPGDFSSTTNCTATLSPGSGCDVTLTFTPTALGSRSASLVIGDSADATLKSIALTGTGVAGKIAIKPSSLSFGKVAVDTASSAKTVTVSNPDSVALAITSITPSGPFSITTNSCDSSLAASSNCQVSVTFNPVSASKSRGTKVSGSLEIADDALKSPQKVKLSGVAFGTASDLSDADGNRHDDDDCDANLYRHIHGDADRDANGNRHGNPDRDANVNHHSDAEHDSNVVLDYDGDADDLRDAVSDRHIVVKYDAIANSVAEHTQHLRTGVELGGAASRNEYDATESSDRNSKFGETHGEKSLPGCFCFDHPDRHRRRAEQQPLPFAVTYLRQHRDGDHQRFV